MINGVKLQYKLLHFQMSEKPKMGNLINVIHKLMYLKFKIQEIIPWRLANHINKHVQSYFICLFDLQPSGKCFHILN